MHEQEDKDQELPAARGEAPPLRRRSQLTQGANKSSLLFMWALEGGGGVCGWRLGILSSRASRRLAVMKYV